MFAEVVMLLAVFISLFVCVEVFQRKTKINTELTRKVVHLGSTLLIALLPYRFSWDGIAATSAVFVIFMLLSKRRKIFQSIHKTRRTTYGEVYFPFSVFVLALFAQNHLVFAYSMLVLGISDSAAEAVGTKLGKHKLTGNKTVEGSTAFFLTSLSIGLVLLLSACDLAWTRILLISLAVSLVSTAAEALSSKGADNLSVPLSIAAVSILLGL
ncbi:MAG TPA: phosphatidate cytidylyltransferase [Candidatus Saccharimonadales bacterium]|nr:phosphatidate cytidylyltransferase [Candidatus Saccharimonadales bacterium]